MPLDKTRGLYTPDFGPEQMQGWVDMGEDQPIDMGPAVGAFQSRFMGNGAQPYGGTAPHGGPTPNMPIMSPHEETGSMDMVHGMPNQVGGAMKGKGTKSL